MKLPKKLRTELEQKLNQYRLSSMFGDGLEIEYLEAGVKIIGTEEMDDEQLVDHFAQEIGADDDDFVPDMKDDILYMKARKIVSKK